jgi:DNA topoisomerase-1
VKHGSVNATIPKDIAPENITLDEALKLIAARAANGKAPKPKTKAKGSKASKTKSKAKPAGSEASA